jgi:hypothetical protein
MAKAKKEGGFIQPGQHSCFCDISEHLYLVIGENLWTEVSNG